MGIWTCFLLLALAEIGLSLNNGLARTPPMGWLDWERFRCDTNCKTFPNHCIDEKLFLTQGAALVKLGLRDLGYVHVNIDDCWSEMERDSEGRLQADHQRFPHGIKYLADEMHKMGLKIGIYGDYGTKTCGGYPGSLGHLQTDAQTFADWGIDMLKMDGCNVDVKLMNTGYPNMTLALNKTGRPIVFSCSWPDYERIAKIPVNYTRVAKYCNLWRNFDDIGDSWDSVASIIQYYGDNQDKFQPVAGPGNWNDPDMIIVGDYGLSVDQAKAQFAIWAMFAAPLLLSVDLTNIAEEDLKIINNTEIIAVNQDKLGVMGRRVLVDGDVQVFSRPLEGNTYAVAFLYLGNGGGPVDTCATLKQMNVSANTVTARDLYERKDLGSFTDKVCVTVDPTSVVILKLNPIK